MPSIAFLGKDINEYNAKSLKYLEGVHFYCPKHGLELTYHCSYSRHVKDYNNEVISIHRLKCPFKGCNHTLSILPDFLQPYKHYSANEIEAVLIDSQTCGSALNITTVASITTVRRWISQYLPILDKKISHLKAVIFEKKKQVVNETALPLGRAMEAIQILLEKLSEIQLLEELSAIQYSNTLGAAFIYTNALAIPT